MHRLSRDEIAHAINLVRRERNPVGALAGIDAKQRIIWDLLHPHGFEPKGNRRRLAEGDFRDRASDDVIDHAQCAARRLGRRGNSETLFGAERSRRHLQADRSFRRADLAAHRINRRLVEDSAAGTAEARHRQKAPGLRFGRVHAASLSRLIALDDKLTG
jgi:hypothetical protein